MKALLVIKEPIEQPKYMLKGNEYLLSETAFNILMCLENYGDIEAEVFYYRGVKICNKNIYIDNVTFILLQKLEEIELVWNT